MGPRLGRLLDRPALTALFNDAFSDYLVPIRLDDEAFAAHVVLNDIDLSASPVAFDGDRPVAFALIAIRGDDAWIGGMGALPSERHRGLGEAVLFAGLDAARERRCGRAWLEVIDPQRACGAPLRAARVRTRARRHRLVARPARRCARPGADTERR